MMLIESKARAMGLSVGTIFDPFSGCRSDRPANRRGARLRALSADGNDVPRNKRSLPISTCDIINRSASCRAVCKDDQRRMPVIPIPLLFPIPTDEDDFEDLCL